MTTFVQFVPPNNAAFAFQAILDGSTYQMSVPWNVFGQRWYLQCLGGNGTLIFNIPVIASPANFGINLIGRWFQVSTLVFRQDTQFFEITP